MVLYRSLAVSAPRQSILFAFVASSRCDTSMDHPTGGIFIWPADSVFMNSLMSNERAAGKVGIPALLHAGCARPDLPEPHC
jgi:hypothetical protein